MSSGNFDSVETQDTHGSTVVLTRSVDDTGKRHYFLGSEQLHTYVENGMLVLRNRNGRTFFLLTENQ